MKKVLAGLLVFVLLLSVSACGGNVSGARIGDCYSEIYSAAEMDAAIDVTLRYFQKQFSGCTLTELSYLGDEKLDGYQDFAERNGADDVIVLVSSFNVDAAGGDGSLNPNSTYTNWKWILVREGTGTWRQVDHGY